MTKIEMYSKEAGCKITFELDSPDVQPSEALAELFAKAVRKLIESNPWDDMPPLDVAIAWSMASVIGHSAVLTEDPKEFIDTVKESFGYYNEEEVH